jgi:hypothetical protein
MVKKKKKEKNGNDRPNFVNCKVPLTKILKHQDIIIPKLEDAVLRSNQFVTLGYEFLKLFILQTLENSQELPIINKAFVKRIFSLIGSGSKQGRKCKTVENDLVSIFYDEVFSKIYPNKLDSVHLSYVLTLASEEMVKCLETNLKTHFIKYINKYINVIIRYPIVSQIKENKEKLNKEQRKVLYNAINNEVKHIKDGVIGLLEIKEDNKYFSFITELRALLPTDIQKSIAYDIKVNPLKYLNVSIKMNHKIEELDRRPYQVIPNRSNLVPKNITLNTSGIIEVINDKKMEIYSLGYSKMNNNAKKYQKYVWVEILRLENRSIFNRKGYRFYNQIQTDGISANLLFIKNEYYNKTYGQRLPDYDEDQEYEIAQLDKLSKEQCLEYSSKKLVGIDPGKKDIFTMVDSDNKFFNYSNCRRRHDTYTKKSKELINIEKNKDILLDNDTTNITKLETLLSTESRVSVSSEKYEKFLILKNTIKNTLDSFYKQKMFRELSLRRFRYSKRSEDNLLNEIEEKYGPGKDLLLGLGDWSVNSGSNYMRGCMPVPNKGLIKVLKKRFTVVSVDEFRTSKLYNRDTSKELTNVKVDGKKIHTLLTPTRNPNGVIVNRDHNASKNILRILKTFIESQTRPIEFMRPKKIENNINDMKFSELVMV